jgi:hypothetical protein
MVDRALRLPDGDAPSQPAKHVPQAAPRLGVGFGAELMGALDGAVDEAGILAQKMECFEMV